MSKETWTLVGVVVGALLGGGAQVLNSWLQASRDRAKVLREERRTAYAEFVAALHEYASTWWTYQKAFRKDPKSPRPSHKERLGSATAVVELLAPADTYDAAGEAVLKVLDWQRTLSFPDGDVIRITDDFMRLAKRDLGVE